MIKPKGKKGIYHCDFYDLEGERVRQSLNTTDKREAKELVAKLMADSEERLKNRRKGGITIEEAFRHTLRTRDEWRSSKSPESIQKVYGYVSKHFGEKATLASLDEATVIKYGEDLIKNGLSASTVNKRLSLISVLFEESIAAGKFHGKAPKFDHYKVKNGRRRVISIEEEQKAIALLLSKPSEYNIAMADLIVVLADTGARLSEALNIVPGRVNMSEQAVLIVDTKNGDDRVVPVTERCLEVFTRRNSTPMFGPLTASNAEHIWSRIRKQMGLENDTEFVLHVFRHTFGSTLANAGVDAFRIKQIMGHRTIQTTEIYVKVATSALKGLPEILEMRKKKHDLNCVQKGAKSATLGDLLKRKTSGDSVGYTLGEAAHNPLVVGSSPTRPTSKSST